LIIYLSRLLTTYRPFAIFFVDEIRGGRRSTPEPEKDRFLV
jgi:hypothetical protein